MAGVTDMRYMFYGASAFNQPIGDWNVANVNDMGGMFRFARAFNQPIGDWKVGNVNDMDGMFGRFGDGDFCQYLCWDMSA
jgi:surface protein